MLIKISAGTIICSSRYTNWKQIPHNEQTYRERYDAWLASESEPIYNDDITREEAVAVQGIMALLPDNIVNWEYGPYPDRLEDALSFLVTHLSDISTNKG
jgi:hypothetical protein